ncbi:hypothetical protein [Oceanobacter sp. 3_MG-2023]|uniref:bestrophin-like domain n=1 Tax=Oceanobacter sp. 3_MG-2023 TaxID=3062622 RepID=UPI0027366B98|nr:hypothetical protein [Oceanobacter sp. 3_MG-2023]MDP2506258.1 hypothetical protein [Oceanobacter sp. 3_MG-2023]
MVDNEFLYGYSSVLIAVVLFLVIIVFNEVGFVSGRYVQSRTDDEVKTLTGSIQASILGLLALLLGFTFSMAMQRYDNRTMALIDEANTMGTAMLRAQLLPGEYQTKADNTLRDYIRLRVEMGQVDLTHVDVRSDYQRQIVALQNQLWGITLAATETDPRPVTTGSFLQSLNAMIDAQGKRNALLQLHVPESILLLLFVVFIASGSIMGYSAGLSGKRMVVPIVLVSLLITLIVFTIIDLDRPKRGLIQVDQNVMSALLKQAR